MREKGFDSVLVTGVSSADEAEFAKLFGHDLDADFRVIRLQKLQRSIGALSELKTLIEIYRVIRREKPQIVHTHTAKAGLLGRVAAVMAGVPVIVHTFHGHVLHGYFNRAVSEVFRGIEWILAKKTTAIITLSEGLKTELSSKYQIAPANKFKVVPLGRDLDTFFAMERDPSRMRNALGIPLDAPFIGTLGRLVPIKNQALMIRAVAELKKEMEVHLAIAGDGELRAELETLAHSLGVSNQVHFLGWRSDLAEIYSGIDVFIMTSINEGTPLSIIEAFATGCPVLSTAVGGVADMFASGGRAKNSDSDFQVCDEGVLVFKHDAKTVANGLRAMLRNRDELKAMSVAAKQRAQLFTDRNLVENMSNLYRELRGNREGRSIAK